MSECECECVCVCVCVRGACVCVCCCDRRQACDLHRLIVSCLLLTNDALINASSDLLLMCLWLRAALGSRDCSQPITALRGSLLMWQISGFLKSCQLEQTTSAQTDYILYICF